MDRLSITVGHRIRTFRKARGITQEELGKRIGKGKGVISKYESGEVVLDVDTLAEISDVLEVPVSAFLSETVPVNQNYSLPYKNFTDSNFIYLYNLLPKKKVNGIIPSCIALMPYEDVGEVVNDRAPIKVYWYSNLKNQDDLTSAVSVIPGMLEVYENLSLLTFVNRKRQNNKTMFFIMNFINDISISDGLQMTVMSFPSMPISNRVVVSKKPIKDEAWLLEKLTINKEDINAIKQYNGFPIRSELLVTPK